MGNRGRLEEYPRPAKEPYPQALITLQQPQEQALGLTSHNTGPPFGKPQPAFGGCGIFHVLQGFGKMAARNLNISESVNKKLRDIVRSMGGGSVQVGFLEGATYPDGTPVAAVAFWNEFGHGGPFPSPARPFFRSMIAKESPGWPVKMASMAKATNYDGPKVLALMGEDIAGALRESIGDLTDPALSPTTLALRAKFGNNPGAIRARDVIQAQRDVAAGKPIASGTQAKPLVWTGHMLNSIGYEVKR
jgi:hypothetical protein